MHPLLTLHKHPGCAEIIVKFKECHEQHPLGKFWGSCNGLKQELDRCFREEKAEKRKANLEAARKFQQKLAADKERAAKEGLPSWTQMQSRTP